MWAEEFSLLVALHDAASDRVRTSIGLSTSFSLSLRIEDSLILSQVLLRLWELWLREWKSLWLDHLHLLFLSSRHEVLINIIGVMHVIRWVVETLLE